MPCIAPLPGRILLEVGHRSEHEAAERRSCDRDQRLHHQESRRSKQPRGAGKASGNQLRPNRAEHGSVLHHLEAHCRCRADGIRSSSIAACPSSTPAGSTAALVHVYERLAARALEGDRLEMSLAEVP
jgi:hypothetical protein